jgi:hypothetical protein
LVLARHAPERTLLSGSKDSLMKKPAVLLKVFLAAIARQAAIYGTRPRRKFREAATRYLDDFIAMKLFAGSGSVLGSPGTWSVSDAILRLVRRMAR